MPFRTDLATEARERLEELPAGVEEERITDDRDITVHRVRITTEEGARALGKPPGNYVTVEAPRIRERDPALNERISRCVALEGRALLPRREKLSYLVVGLGNRRITADSLGPAAVSEIIVTRHILPELGAEEAGGMENVCAVSPGVLGVTGIDTYDMLSGIVSRVRPDVLIVIDSLSAGKTARIGTSIQLSDTGITPGSASGGRGGRICEETLGIPVLCVGVPLVVQASTLVFDALGAQEEPAPETLDRLKGTLPEEGFASLVVTPREVDVLVADCARILSVGLNLMMHRGITVDEIYGFLR